VDKIKKTLQTMLPLDRILQHQYCAKNYKTYSDLIHDLLQAEKHDELTLRNHHQHSIGNAPLPEVHYNVKSNKKGDGSKNQHKKFGKFKKGKRNGRNMENRSKGKGKAKARYLYAINVVVQTILLENAKPLNIWLNYTKNP
jgi:hypothetical protein